MARALNWVSDLIGPGTRVIRSRRLVGGITSSMHAISILDERKQRHELVLRRWVDSGRGSPGALVQREAEVLNLLAATDLPVPRLVRADPDGASAGHPAILMTRLPGRVYLEPSDTGRWLDEIVSVLPRIHSTCVEGRAYRHRIDATDLEVPAWSKRPSLWREAFKVVQVTPPPYEPTFIHHDFQHFNLLWSRGRLSGVVDWAYASMGPPDRDVGHCRLNLAVLFSAEMAERFRLKYEAEAGRRVDPWWDLASLMSYGEEWKTFIPIQAGRRARVDTAGMSGRVEELVALVLRRL